MAHMTCMTFGYTALSTFAAAVREPVRYGKGPTRCMSPNFRLHWSVRQRSRHTNNNLLLGGALLG